jgi:hypothetical protein
VLDHFQELCFGCFVQVHELDTDASDVHPVRLLHARYPGPHLELASAQLHREIELAVVGQGPLLASNIALSFQVACWFLIATAPFLFGRNAPWEARLASLLVF